MDDITASDFLFTCERVVKTGRGSEGVDVGTAALVKNAFEKLNGIEQFRILGESAELLLHYSLKNT